ncbi:LOW QUALITY PROTEIN: hypothetical protein Cgig2_024986 [Carnegiea gigantea]|uniref:Photosystem II CP47 chlorophyll apoprotein n=1 Tax=Carnegiea gigantea TaxID=171969 RepID=A0A9Q1GTT0_9CARY|nr:LOW QUALITY PROTEIN: hypothetical protein Cgig2_024986 [Carnegiea gigantea]
MGWLEYYGGDYNRSGYLELRRCGQSAYCVFWRVLFGSYLALGVLGSRKFFVINVQENLPWICLKACMVPEYGCPILGITGKVQPVNPAWGVEGFDPFFSGGVASHHIEAGTLGILAGLFHLSPQRLYKGLRMVNIETVLSSTIAAAFFTAFVVARTMWYGSITTPIKLFGPTRHQWDQGYFQRAESKYSVEQVAVTVEFYGGKLNGVSYSDPTTFGHAFFALLFFFGHIWHRARTLFRDVFADIDPDLDALVEFGAFQKLGDPTARRQGV